MTNPDPDLSTSFAGFSTAGYIYAPYIPVLVMPTLEEIKEQTRIPIKLIKTAMKQAGYKINRDFTISDAVWDASVFVTTRPGRRFDHHGQCRVSILNGKLCITWTYEPTPGGKSHDSIDVRLADPECFIQISNAIVRALKENHFRPISPPGYTKRVHASYYGKVTL